MLIEYPKVTQFYGALGQAYLANGQLKESQAVLDKGISLFPRNAPLTIRLADTLMHEGDNKRAQLILDDLFNQVEPTPNQAKLIAKAANAAGNIADSYYYMADYYLMNGDLVMASNQLQLGLGLPNLESHPARPHQRNARRSTCSHAEKSQEYGCRRQRGRKRSPLIAQYLP